MKNVRRISGFETAPFRSFGTSCNQHRIHWFRMVGTDNVVPFLDDVVLTTESRFPFSKMTLAGDWRYEFHGFHDGILVYSGLPMTWDLNCLVEVEPWLLELLERGFMTGDAP